MKKTIFVLIPLAFLCSCTPLALLSGFSLGADHADKITEPERTRMKEEITNEVRAELFLEVKDVLSSKPIQHILTEQLQESE